VTDEGDAKPHLFIAGTGRAGTSFLVRLLAELGLETHLQRHGPGQWFEGPNAGFEDLPLPGLASALPYVVKSPWLYQVIDSVLADPAIRIDAVILPVRRLADAAASRIVVQRQAMHAQAPWLTMLPTPWDSWGAAPGGVVYSLEALDQARVLAVGLHVLIERLVAAEIPIVFLDFPRLAQDPAYLFRHLQPWLPAGTTPDAVAAAHGKLADPAKIRTEAERAPPTDTALDAAALKRELAVTRAHLATARHEAAVLRASTSWRVMAPLRAIARALRRAR
jgi:hypothetical protein